MYYFPRIPAEQRANIYAHAMSFPLNVTGYILLPTISFSSGLKLPAYHLSNFMPQKALNSLIKALWSFMIAVLILSLEQIKSPNLNRQIIVIAFYLITTTCIAIGMNAPSHTYVHLKVINSLIGISIGFLALGI